MSVSKQQKSAKKPRLVETPAIAAAGNADPEVKLEDLIDLNSQLEEEYQSIFRVEDSLTRSLVSFQANKARAIYRWFKYKEGFSATLIERLIQDHCPLARTLLDPFAGSGTAMFVASAMGLRGEGIELLPIGHVVIETKQVIDLGVTAQTVARLADWAEHKPWASCPEIRPLNQLRITRNAFPPATAEAMGRYLAAIETESHGVRAILRFALLCVLENVSYTRKDGQYLRWDHRAGRRVGKKIFDKGRIVPFAEAISEKLRQIVGDIGGSAADTDLFSEAQSPSNISLHRGSCLSILPTLRVSSYDCIITSPPYCNRYDYTRTYALELAMLGVDEPGLSQLRQEMLSCTVENRGKDLLALNPNWSAAVMTANDQPLLQALLAYLDAQLSLGLLNNAGIPRMVRGYFYEMACVISECARVLKPGAKLLMVNDNVRYAGASVSVDIILSELAKRLGFEVERILVLPSGKGNSSQQMGAHGRDALRKCVYVWRKE